MGNSDLSPGRRGLVIFPAPEPEERQRSDWWLVPAALIVAATLIAVAFAIR